MDETNSTVPEPNASVTPASAGLVTEFNSLVKQWVGDTVMHSSPSVIFAHPAYQRIITMGQDALPLILTDLRTHSRLWFDALEAIVGQDVAEGATNFSDAKVAWLKWGKEKKFI